MVGAASAADIVRRDTGGGGHDHSHAHAAAAAPASGYAEPQGSGYAAPATGYTQQSSGYAAPSSYGGYETAGYEEDGGFDLSTIIIPILIIFGLSLLFPTVTSVAVGNRKRRDLDGGKQAQTITLIYIYYYTLTKTLLNHHL